MDVIRNGYRLSFTNHPTALMGPYCDFYNGHKPEEVPYIISEIEKLYHLGVVVPAESSMDQVLSPIFLTDKKDGSKRMILNLKRLNRYIEYQHFKMEGLNTVKDLITQGCYLASVDLEKAYYSVPIHKEHRKYLRFEFQGSTWEFTCLPNGLASAPRIFTKLMKIPFSSLRAKGLKSCIYIDDTCLFGDTFDECKRNVDATVTSMQLAGFFHK